MINKKELIIGASIIAILPNIALAYIDPASGSALMSAIIGIFVASGIFIKTYWYKIKSLFVKGKGQQKTIETADAKNTQKPN